MRPARRNEILAAMSYLPRCGGSRAALIGAAAVLIAGCGSGGAQSVVSSLTSTIQSKTGQATIASNPTPTDAPAQTTTVTRTETVTTPGRTETVTAPAQTTTVVHTQATTTSPTATSTTSGHAGAAAAVGAAAAKENEPSESSGLPGWAWVLIGAAATGLVVWAVQAIRRRHARHRNSPPPAAPSTTGPSGPEPG